MWKYGFAKPEAGVFGDSFGFVNSLFSSFAFLIATYALIMQIQESHESGRIQEKQIDIQTTQLAIADRTASLLKDQTEIARATAQIQESIRRDVQRETAMTALLKIEQDAMRYRH